MRLAQRSLVVIGLVGGLGIGTVGEAAAQTATCTGLTTPASTSCNATDTRRGAGGSSVAVGIGGDGGEGGNGGDASATSGPGGAGGRRDTAAGGKGGDETSRGGKGENDDSPGRRGDIVINVGNVANVANVGVIAIPLP